MRVRDDRLLGCVQWGDDAVILVVGPCASGKRTYALSCGYAPEDVIDIALLLDNTISSDSAEASIRFFDWLRQMEGSVVCDVHLLAKCDCDVDRIADVLASKDMVLCTEVGAGVVPIDKGDREFRERAGRLSVELANRAEKVVRMVCGIPVVLKG